MTSLPGHNHQTPARTTEEGVEESQGWRERSEQRNEQKGSTQGQEGKHHDESAGKGEGRPK